MTRNNFLNGAGWRLFNFWDSSPCDSELNGLYFFVEIEDVDEDDKIVHFLNQRFVKAVYIVVLSRKQEMAGVLYFENFRELVFLIFYFSLIVHFNRSNIVYFDGEPESFHQPYRSIWKQIISFFDSQESLIWA